MNTVKSFVKEFAALLTGDTATAKAEKSLRQADSALKTQIASLKGDTISYEDAVDDAKENEKKALLNFGQEITSSTRGSYVQNLLNAANKVTDAVEKHEAHLAKIKFLEGKLEILGKEENVA